MRRLLFAARAPRCVFLPLLLISACSEAPQAQRSEPDSLTADSGRLPEQPDSAALVRLRRTLPPELLVRRNACPFECCVYGNWLADGEIRLYQEPRRTATPAFTLSKGQKLRADSGIVYVTSIAFAVVDDTVFRYADQRPWLLPGDTLVLLEPIGEGYWTMWRRGEILNEVPPFFESVPEPKRGHLVGTPQREWWVHATVGRQSGWFHADSSRVRGADACAGPVEGL